MIVFHIADRVIEPGETRRIKARTELIAYLPRTLFAHNGERFALHDVRALGVSKLEHYLRGYGPVPLSRFIETYKPTPGNLEIGWIEIGGDFEIVVENTSDKTSGFFAAWGCTDNTGTMKDAIAKYEEFLARGRWLSEPGPRGELEGEAKGEAKSDTDSKIDAPRVLEIREVPPRRRRRRLKP